MSLKAFSAPSLLRALNSLRPSPKDWTPSIVLGSLALLAMGLHDYWGDPSNLQFLFLGLGMVVDVDNRAAANDTPSLGLKNEDGTWREFEDFARDILSTKDCSVLFRTLTELVIELQGETLQLPPYQGKSRSPADTRMKLGMRLAAWAILQRIAALVSESSVPATGSGYLTMALEVADLPLYPEMATLARPLPASEKKSIGFTLDQFIEMILVLDSDSGKSLQALFIDDSDPHQRAHPWSTVSEHFPLLQDWINGSGDSSLERYADCFEFQEIIAAYEAILDEQDAERRAITLRTSVDGTDLALYSRNLLAMDRVRRLLLETDFDRSVAYLLANYPAYSKPEKRTSSIVPGMLLPNILRGENVYDPELSEENFAKLRRQTLKMFQCLGGTSINADRVDALLWIIANHCAPFSDLLAVRDGVHSVEAALAHLLVKRPNEAPALKHEALYFDSLLRGALAKRFNFSEFSRGENLLHNFQALQNMSDAEWRIFTFYLRFHFHDSVEEIPGMEAISLILLTDYSWAAWEFADELRTHLRKHDNIAQTHFEYFKNRARFLHWPLDGVEDIALVALACRLGLFRGNRTSLALQMAWKELEEPCRRILADELVVPVTEPRLWSFRNVAQALCNLDQKTPRALRNLLEAQARIFVQARKLDFTSRNTLIDLQSLAKYVLQNQSQDPDLDSLRNHRFSFIRATKDSYQLKMQRETELDLLSIPENRLERAIPGPRVVPVALEAAPAALLAQWLQSARQTIPAVISMFTENPARPEAEPILEGLYRDSLDSGDPGRLGGNASIPWFQVLDDGNREDTAHRIRRALEIVGGADNLVLFDHRGDSLQDVEQELLQDTTQPVYPFFRTLIALQTIESDATKVQTAILPQSVADPSEALQKVSAMASRRISLAAPYETLTEYLRQRWALTEKVSDDFDRLLLSLLAACQGVRGFAPLSLIADPCAKDFQDFNPFVKISPAMAQLLVQDGATHLAALTFRERMATFQEIFRVPNTPRTISAAWLEKLRAWEEAFIADEPSMESSEKLNVSGPRNC